jgi:hypothetical protein
MESIGIEEAHDLYNELHGKNHLMGIGNSWRYWLRKRNKIKKLIDICGIEISFHKVGRKICVDKQDFLKKVQERIKEKIERENGPIEGKGIVHGNFVELDRVDSGMIESYYVCRKCENTATTRNEKPECHTCSDWNGCGRNCTLSHLVCKKCDIIQKV